MYPFSAYQPPPSGRHHPQHLANKSQAARKQANKQTCLCTHVHNTALHAQILVHNSTHTCPTCPNACVDLCTNVQKTAPHAQMLIYTCAQHCPNACVGMCTTLPVLHNVLCTRVHMHSQHAKMLVHNGTQMCTRLPHMPKCLFTYVCNTARHATRTYVPHMPKCLCTSVRKCAHEAPHALMLRIDVHNIALHATMFVHTCTHTCPTCSNACAHMCTNVHKKPHIPQ